MSQARINASALYLVIVIALVIGILCSALIAVAYFYRAEYQKNGRYGRLQANLSSAVRILVSGQDTIYREQTFSLFGEDRDSIRIKRIYWGMYDIGTAQAFINGDTLYKTFSMAHLVDSSRWCALYLVDNGRPLGLSGKTGIRGDVFIPPAGVNQAYVDNQAYSGNPALLTGKRRNSGKQLPTLNAGCLQQFKLLFARDSAVTTSESCPEKMRRSFLKETTVIHFKHEPVTISNTTLTGNIVLFSDTTLTIDSTTSLHHVIVIAKAIIVKPGFIGDCQLFATDSISAGKRSKFCYPSCLGIIRFGQSKAGQVAPMISLQDYAVLNGSAFIYQEKITPPEPLLSIGKQVLVKGQVYAPGNLQLSDHAEIDGCVYAQRLLYQTIFTRYENYLVNVTLDENALSPYYLASSLLSAAGPKKQVLEWIEQN